MKDTVRMSGRRNKPEARVPSIETNGNDNDGVVLQLSQDPKIRRQIRRTYREIIQTISENREEMCRPNSDSLRHQLAQCNSVFLDVTMPREAACDSYAVHVISDLAKQKAQALRTDFMVFDWVDFGQKVKEKIAEGFTGTEDPQETWRQACRPSRRKTKPREPQEPYTGPGLKAWATFGQLNRSKYMKVAPAMTFVFGILNDYGSPKKVKPPRAPREKEKDAQVVQPIRKTDFSNDQKGECTTEEVEKIYKILKKKYKDTQDFPVDYFEFVVNPHSFSQTVENIFYTSFLIKDGKVRMFIDGDRLPALEPVSPDQLDKEQSFLKKPNLRRQTVIELSQEEWEEIIHVYDIDEPMIPTRPRKVSPVRPRRRPCKDPPPFRPLDFLEMNKPKEFNLEEALASSKRTRGVPRGRGRPSLLRGQTTLKFQPDRHDEAVPSTSREDGEASGGAVVNGVIRKAEEPIRAGGKRGRGRPSMKRGAPSSRR